MKKFLIAALTLLAVFCGGWYGIFQSGFYLDLRPDAPVSAAFRTEGKELLRQNKEGGWEPFLIRGVDVSSSLPGHYAAEFAPEEEDYLRWLTAIGEMGANTVRVNTIMDEDFYNAVYSYNSASQEPLFLMQGIQVSDAANQGKEDAYHEDFLGRLLEDGKTAVDVIHGRRVIASSEMSGTGNYRQDISPWVIGYLVGQEWNADTVAYTDHSLARTGEYQGFYFQTGEDATAFEAMLAQVMDTLVGYESDKYKVQRPIGFICDPSMDFLVYAQEYDHQLNKYCYLDAERVMPTKNLISGYFAAYRLYDFCPDFSRYLSEGQKAELGGLLDHLDADAPYNGYLQLVAAHHTIPVIAAGYGFSSARGAVSPEREPLTEREQGQALMEVDEAAREAGWTGVFISTWQDIWERRSWNTAFATILTRNYLWHDLQTEGQNFGLMAFEPGKEQRACVLDGNPGEWKEEDRVLSAGGLTLSARQDEEGLYLLLRGKGVSPDKTLYLPIDITGESGSTECAEPALTFDRAADFLLCVEGRESSRLLVQERYDAVRENFLWELTGENPFVVFPAADSANFVPVTMVLENNSIISASEALTLSPAELTRRRALGIWETGRLIHGNGDPTSADYNSLADFCFGEECVEIRLPWLLLNVADPSQPRAHRDYYEYYGVRSQRISEIWLGAGDGSAAIGLNPLPLQGWKFPSARERLKESYYVARDAWKGTLSHAF